MVAFLLAFLELTFVMVAIMLLHNLKRSIGTAGFYLALGMFFVLGQIIGSAQILLDPGLAGLQINLGNAMLLAPYMVALLIVYILDGTLEAQRLILGMLALLTGYWYLANLTGNQCVWSEYSSNVPGGTAIVGALFLQGRRTMAASVCAHAVDLFVLPIVFQILQNRHCRLFFCVLGTLVFVQVLDSFIFQLIAAPQLSNWWGHLRMTYMARASIMVWLSILTTVYLHLCRFQQRGEGRRPLDIVVAFFGGYGRAQELQKHLREWEGRYSIVIQNSSDLIFILNQHGRILNANDAALASLGYRPQDVGFELPSIMRNVDGSPCDWRDLWLELNPDETSTQAMPGHTRIHRDWQGTTAKGEALLLDVSISPAVIRDEPGAVVIARDVTERRHLEHERERLQEQLLHAQRMEAIGQLAGGVAHDFNNLLHTIQGSLDGLEKLGRENESQHALLGNIAEATRRASSLTTQLLGFARKGKYQTEKLDVGSIMDSARTLFEPLAHRDLRFKLILAPTPMHIRGDSTQLQQVFLNLLINARDAVQERGKKGKIVFRAEPAADYTPGWSLTPSPNAKPDDYVCIRIKDDGIGIPDEVKAQIFDPFFTTKDVGKGTGMGLAMVYGCISNHNGWVHVQSELGKGTEFFLFLPRA